MLFLWAQRCGWVTSEMIRMHRGMCQTRRDTSGRMPNPRMPFTSRLHMAPQPIQSKHPRQNTSWPSPSGKLTVRVFSAPHGGGAAASRVQWRRFGTRPGSERSGRLTWRSSVFRCFYVTFCYFMTSVFGVCIKVNLVERERRLRWFVWVFFFSFLLHWAQCGFQNKSVCCHVSFLDWNSSPLPKNVSWTQWNTSEDLFLQFPSIKHTFYFFLFFLAATEAENPHSSSVSRLQEEPGSVRELPESQDPPDPPVISLVLERNFRKINLIHQRICN